MQGTTEDAMEINSAMNYVARTDEIQGPQVVVYYTNRKKSFTTFKCADIFTDPETVMPRTN